MIGVKYEPEEQKPAAPYVTCSVTYMKPKLIEFHIYFAVDLN